MKHRIIYIHSIVGMRDMPTSQISRGSGKEIQAISNASVGKPKMRVSSLPQVGSEDKLRATPRPSVLQPRSRHLLPHYAPCPPAPLFLLLPGFESWKAQET